MAIEVTFLGEVASKQSNFCVCVCVGNPTLMIQAIVNAGF